MDFIDAQCGFGGYKPGVRKQFSVEAMLEQQEHLGISRALVRILPCEDDDNVAHSNEELYAACQKYQERLIPCPVFVPDMLNEFGGDEGQVRDAVTAGAGAAFLRPNVDSWILEPWVCETLLANMGTYGLPAYFSASAVSMDKLAKMASAFPNVKFIYSDVSYRMLRTLLPLMAKWHNVYVTTGCNFNFHVGYETFQKLVGTDRLLFGTGLPNSEPGAALGFLTYSSLDEHAKKAIASENFLKLLGEIKK